MCSHRQCFGVLVLPTLVVALLHSQTIAPDSGENHSTFRADVRVVVTDVVVTDNRDNPVQGLSKEDFHVLEDGQPQTISSFEEHKDAPPVQAKLPPLPPQVFTNFPQSALPETINVLLLDALNTPLLDQVSVRSQMVRYLKKIRPGTYIAIFTLASRLRFVQGFTTDSSVLLAALNKKGRASPQPSPLLHTTMDDNVDQQLVAAMADIPGGSHASADALQQFQADIAAFQLKSRVEITLQAFHEIARYLASFPGRKNIIWFSSSFPFSIFPDPTLHDSFNIMQQDAEAIRGTTDLLAAARVAIYPIAAEGLDTERLHRQSTQRLVEELQNESLSRNANHGTSDEIAKDTGGEAFYNTNGLNDVLARVINNGTHYYTLSYTPTDKRMDGGFRSIKVNLSEDKYKLSYRRGYFTEDAKKPRTLENADPLQPLMSRGMPDFAQIPYTLRVVASNQPAKDAERAGDNTKLKGPVTRYSVDFAISLKDLKIEVTPDGRRHSTIEVRLVAYDHDGTPLNWLARMAETSLKPELYAAFLQGGLPLHQEIDVPEGAVYLRTGVYDPAMSKAGTLEIPLNAVMK